MIDASIGDLVWVPDRTRGRNDKLSFGKCVVYVNGPLIGLVMAQDTNEMKVNLNMDGVSRDISFMKRDIYALGDLYG
jgi:hypothetical protein